MKASSLCIRYVSDLMPARHPPLMVCVHLTLLARSAVCRDSSGFPPSCCSIWPSAGAFPRVFLSGPDCCSLGRCLLSSVPLPFPLDPPCSSVPQLQPHSLSFPPLLQRVVVCTPPLLSLILEGSHWQ